MRASVSISIFIVCAVSLIYMFIADFGMVP